MNGIFHNGILKVRIVKNLFGLCTVKLHWYRDNKSKGNGQFGALQIYNVLKEARSWYVQQMILPSNISR